MHKKDVTIHLFIRENSIKRYYNARKKKAGTRNKIIYLVPLCLAAATISSWRVSMISSLWWVTPDGSKTKVGFFQ
ncbi:Protein CBG25273 [Caenorhabditis briggsae]|uniref:Protein CBG25273 n=1 Tax=Caenorhabditis briggsae TaxID=6238 RepID=B6IIJ1_CAEBR|nr:Protein CBG25273 [Caenorhabditis briggsae]CAR99721.1 Protein CBG25273 [Caenorhabditis briggsae]